MPGAYPPRSTDRRAVKLPLLYLLLVGLPLAGLFAVLRIGAGIEAPPAVGGPWKTVEGGRCSVPDSLFRIDQSGRFVHVVLPGRPDIPAQLSGPALAADGGARADVSPGCASGAVRIRLRADGRVARRLVGTAGVPGCAACPEARFVAARVAPDSTKPAQAH